MTINNLHNTNIERAILSTIIFEPSIFEDVLGALNPDDFYLPDHKVLFETMIELEKANKPIDEGVVEFESIVFDNDVTSVTNNKAIEFSLYPNPAKDFINIESPKTISSVAVMDITGKVVINVNNLKNNRINISDLLPGVYMVSVKDNNDNVSTQRLIISE